MVDEDELKYMSIVSNCLLLTEITTSAFPAAPITTKIP